MKHAGVFARLVLSWGLTAFAAPPLGAAELPIVARADPRALFEHVQRVSGALDSLGAPLPLADKTALKSAKTAGDIQKVLDRHCLIGININPEQRVKARPGPAAAILEERGWRAYLVKIANESGTTAPLKVSSPHAAPVSRTIGGAAPPAPGSEKAGAPARWMEIALHESPALRSELSGLEVEYKILRIYAGGRELGWPQGAPVGGRGEGAFKREARLSFDVGQGTQDLGFRSEVDVLFTCNPASAARK